MTNKQRNLIKKKILMCLTENFKNNQAIFSKEGWQVFHGTDLTMVMDAVVKGLEFAQTEIELQEIDCMEEGVHNMPKSTGVKKKVKRGTTLGIFDPNSCTPLPFK